MQCRTYQVLMAGLDITDAAKMADFSDDEFETAMHIFRASLFCQLHEVGKAWDNLKKQLAGHLTNPKT